jgi:hypothetical protein
VAYSGTILTSQRQYPQQLWTQPNPLHILLRTARSKNMACTFLPSDRRPHWICGPLIKLFWEFWFLDSILDLNMLSVS